MENRILGLHHITAIAENAQRNYDFYTKILGLRLVKKTVNFDDPETYHFYFGNETGTPGTILTFFPWEGIKKGRNGAGMATDIGYSIPEKSLGFWKERFEKLGVHHDAINERFGEKHLAFQDPDGLSLNLIETKHKDNRKGWETAEVKTGTAIKGFHNVTLTLINIKATAAILTELFTLLRRSTEIISIRSISVSREAYCLKLPQITPGLPPMKPWKSLAPN